MASLIITDNTSLNLQSAQTAVGLVAQTVCSALAVALASRTAAIVTLAIPILGNGVALVLSLGFFIYDATRYVQARMDGDSKERTDALRNAMIASLLLSAMNAGLLALSILFPPAAPIAQIVVTAFLCIIPVGRHLALHNLPPPGDCTTQPPAPKKPTTSTPPATPKKPATLTTTPTRKKPATTTKPAAITNSTAIASTTAVTKPTPESKAIDLVNNLSSLLSGEVPSTISNASSTDSNASSTEPLTLGAFSELLRNDPLLGMADRITLTPQWGALDLGETPSEKERQEHTELLERIEKWEERLKTLKTFQNIPEEESAPLLPPIPRKPLLLKNSNNSCYADSTLTALYALYDEKTLTTLHLQSATPEGLAKDFVMRCLLLALLKAMKEDKKDDAETLRTQLLCITCTNFKDKNSIEATRQKFKNQTEPGELLANWSLTPSIASTRISRNTKPNTPLKICATNSQAVNHCVPKPALPPPFPMPQEFRKTLTSQEASKLLLNLNNHLAVAKTISIENTLNTTFFTERTSPEEDEFFQDLVLFSPGEPVPDHLECRIVREDGLTGTDTSLCSNPLKNIFTTTYHLQEGVAEPPSLETRVIKKRTEYSLEGVLIHSGNQSGGHHTALVHVGNQWVYYDDVVSAPNNYSPEEAEIKAAKGQFFFYKKVENSPCHNSFVTIQQAYETCQASAIELAAVTSAKVTAQPKKRSWFEKLFG